MLGAYPVSGRGFFKPSRLRLEAYSVFRLDRPGWLGFETGHANLRRVIMLKTCCDFSSYDDLAVIVQKVWLSGLDDVFALCFFFSPYLHNHPRLQWPDSGYVT